MKKKNILPIIFSLILLFTIYKIFEKIHQKQQIAENIKALPAFYFYDMNDGLFTDVDLPQNTAVLIIHFHPECEFCRHEAQIIENRIKDFSPYQLLFVSSVSKKEIINYANEFNLSAHKNITFLHDKDMIFENIFGKSGIPASFIYNKNQELVKQFKGEVKAAALLKYLGQ